MGPPPPPRPSGPRTWVPGLLTGAGVTLLPSLVAVGFGPDVLLAVAAASTLLLAPAALLVGTVLACIHTTRNFGIGLLIAAGVGVIVLGGTCVGAINWSSMRTAP